MIELFKEWGAFGISLVALIFSVFTYVKESDQRAINKYIRAKMENEQSPCVCLDCDVERYVTSNGRTGQRLVVSNYGNVAAKNVNVDFEKEANEVYMCSSGILPYESLEPNHSFGIVMGICLGSPDKIYIKLSWENDDGTRQTESKIVCLA